LLMRENKPARYGLAPVPATPGAIAEAITVLRDGGVVAFPTETVYGLGADAGNEAAVRLVFAVKGRPADHPLIVHLASAEALTAWALHVPESAWRLAQAFWPGPITLVLPRQPWVNDVVTGGQDSVALRVPAHPIALELLADNALVAPSANRFGRVSPTCAEHVSAELGESVDMILDGGNCEVGVESTIVSLLDDKPALLRPGGVSLAAIERVLGHALTQPPPDIRTPGRLPAHYAPATPLAQLLQQGKKTAVLTCGPVDAANFGEGVYFEAMPTQAALYARSLYATLRRIDAAGFSVLLVQEPPQTVEWLAVRDRLMRAAAQHVVRLNAVFDKSPRIADNP
jgi:L-threonylcarbamoyladenylate synthase